MPRDVVLVEETVESALVMVLNGKSAEPLFPSLPRAASTYLPAGVLHHCDPFASTFPASSRAFTLKYVMIPGVRPVTVDEVAPGAVTRTGGSAKTPEIVLCDTRYTMLPPGVQSSLAGSQESWTLVGDSSTPESMPA